MPTPKQQRRRALELLEASIDGCTEAIMLSYGFKSDRERALKYLECCYKQGMSWKDAEQQIQDCLQQRGVPREGILRQLKLARPLLQPWLD
jgi:hypothetical protein